MFSSFRTQVNFHLSNLQKHRATRQQESKDYTPAASVTLSVAALYVLSGVTQPLLMTLAKEAGLADPTCQICMLFYYLGPASVLFSLRSKNTISQRALFKSAFIACFDLSSQTLNYTGSAMAGPTIFAIIYSSIAVWTAVFSRVLLSRSLTPWQWLGVLTVFGGLAITGFDSVSMGRDVFRGSCLVTVGSMMNALTYVMSEAVMTKGDEPLSAQVNCAVQGIVGSLVLLVWQVVYTRPRFDSLIQQPMKIVHTSNTRAVCILLSIGVANFIHYICFFHTIKFVWGGSTSAGVMKALQAVLVFLVTSLAYCGRMGGEEMCFSLLKFVSLVIVVFGVLLFGKATAQAGKKDVIKEDHEEQLV